MNIVVIGFKSAGKSTVGACLAEQIGYSFDDLDRRLSEKASLELGKSVDFREAFRLLGEARFRELESSLLREAMAEDGLVLSLGGGAPLDQAAPGLVEGHCVVYIRAPEEDLVRRTRAGGWPAYLEGEPDPESALRRLLRERIPRYEAMADVVIDNPDDDPPSRSAEAGARQVQEWMKARR
ncbi:MAG: shikimate kinase [bacterium]